MLKAVLLTAAIVVTQLQPPSQRDVAFADPDVIHDETSPDGAQLALDDQTAPEPPPPLGNNSIEPLQSLSESCVGAIELVSLSETMTTYTRLFDIARACPELAPAEACRLPEGSDPIMVSDSILQLTTVCFAELCPDATQAIVADVHGRDVVEALQTDCPALTGSDLLDDATVRALFPPDLQLLPVHIQRVGVWLLAESLYMRVRNSQNEPFKNWFRGILGETLDQASRSNHTLY